MSVRLLTNSASSNADVDAKTFPTFTPQTAAPWVRNPSWPACEANSGDNRFRGLYAVWPNTGNALALSCVGSYVIDFGDGSTPLNQPNFSQVNYLYNYNASTLVGTEAPVTFTDVGDLVTRTAHGYTDGMQVQFFNIVTTTGLVEGQFYFVINATANTFQVADTTGGTAVAITNNGTGQLLPYRIAVVTVTPQPAQTITQINLAEKYPGTSPFGYSTGWLDMAVAFPGLTVITIGGVTPLVQQDQLERVRINQTGVYTNFSNVFRGLRALQKVEIASGISTSITNMNNMFQSCVNLREAPSLVTNSVQFTQEMFSGCTSLISVPNYNLAALQDASSMFLGCTALQTVPLFTFRTSGSLTLNSMFQGCSSLVSVPLFNMVAVVSSISMFSSCSNLVSVPSFNLAGNSSLNSMFVNCRNLRQVPLFNIRTTGTVGMNNMFASCVVLETVPLFNTANVNNMGSLFNGCSALKSVPLFNTASVVNTSQMFSSCISLTTVPLFNTSNVTNANSMFSSCSALVSMPPFNLSSATNLVTFASGCTSLREVPLLTFRTASAVDATSMFANCESINRIPLLNTSNVTNMNAMFSGCGSLVEIPALVTTAVSSAANFTSTFPSIRSTVSRIQAKNFRFSFSVANCRLSATALTEIFDNLPTVASTQTLTITTTFGSGTAQTRAINTTAQSVTLPTTNTTSLAIGQMVTGTGTGITTGISVASDVTANTFTLTAHGLADGKRVSFSTLGSTTGISLFTTYFVVGSTANTFQVALTAGGAAIDLTGTNSTLNARYPSYITAITPGVSVTLDTPAATTTVSSTLSFRALDTSSALLRNWAITF